MGGYEVVRITSETEKHSENEPYPYINSLILNDRVYVPVDYNKGLGLTELDKKAMLAYEKATPGYKIVPVQPDSDDDYWRVKFRQEDALHCRTKEIPVGIISDEWKDVNTLSYLYENLVI